MNHGKGILSDTEGSAQSSSVANTATSHSVETNNNRNNHHHHHSANNYRNGSRDGANSRGVELARRMAIQQEPYKVTALKGSNTDRSATLFFTNVRTRGGNFTNNERETYLQLQRSGVLKRQRRGGAPGGSHGDGDEEADSFEAFRDKRRRLDQASAEQVYRRAAGAAPGSTDAPSGNGFMTAFSSESESDTESASGSDGSDSSSSGNAPEAEAPSASNNTTSDASKK